jgi:tetratricopeptide (TPR) repeat protein
LIFALLFAASEPAKAPGLEEQRFADCVAQVESDAEAAIRSAENWRLSGGDLNARLCLGLAYAQLKRWPAAQLAFELAAQDAERKRDGRSAGFWVQAGNAALAGGQFRQARNALDSALSSGLLKGADEGEAHLDRARASAALGELAPARTDIDMALKLIPADPLGWLLSATLARREGNLVRAGSDIEEAAKRAPDDAAVALEAGNIAILNGAPEAAKRAWQAAVKNGAETPAGKAAAEALKQF